MYQEPTPPQEKDVLIKLKLYANMARSDIRDRSQAFCEK